MTDAQYDNWKLAAPDDDLEDLDNYEEEEDDHERVCQCDDCANG